jgi:hypothetical protein
MFWVITFCTVSGAYVAIYRRPPVPAPIFGIVVLLALFGGLYWLGAVSGFHDAVIESWKVLAGVDGPGEIVQRCDDPAFIAIIGILLGFVLIVLAAIAGLGGIVAAPVGLVMTAIGALAALFDSDSDLLKTGLGVLAAGVGGIVAAGIIFRVIHWVTGIGC